MPTQQSRYHLVEDTCDGRCTQTAVSLCLSSPVAWSMTPRQIAVFQQLCFLQMEDGGPHSLLPNVIHELLALARRPWWDRGVAGLTDDRFTGGREGTLGYYEALAQIFSERRAPTAEVFDSVIGRMHALSGMQARTPLAILDDSDVETD